MADEDALAPDLSQREIRSILLSAERRGRIDDDLVYTALSRFRGLPRRLVSRSDDAEVVRVARRYQLSAYDTAYLALVLLENARWQHLTGNLPVPPGPKVSPGTALPEQ